MISAVSLLVIIGVLSIAFAWDHDHQDEWGNHFEKCNGNHQSPVNFNTHHHMRVIHSQMKFLNYEIPIEGVNLPINNTGHSVAISFRSIPERKRPSIKRKDIYLLEELHFHWGSNRYQGSDHTFDGESYSMEAHFVHRNSKYSTFAEALNNTDGLSVLGIIFQEIHCKRTLAQFTSVFNQIKTCRHSSRLSGIINLGKIFPSIWDHSFVNYAGSLTTPECNEVVEWFVYPLPVKVSSKDVSWFANYLIRILTCFCM